MPGFFRLLAVCVAYSRQLRCQLPNTSDAMRNAIGLHLHFHHPLSHTAQASGLLLRFSCFSASACLPVNVSPFSSVPRLAHFAEKDSLFRDTRQSLACRTHAPSQPPTNTHVPDLSGRLSSSPPVFQSVATHDPLPFLRSDSPDFSHADATSALLPPFRPSNTSVGRCKSTMPTAISGAPSVTAT
jgi:hypothetical protein